MEKQKLPVNINMIHFEFGIDGVEDRKNYTRTLLTEIESAADYADDFEVSQLCITGSNPLQYHGDGLGNIINKVRNTLPMKKDAEITVNAQPGSVIYADLLNFRSHRVSRISFDMGSFIEAELETLGRTYSASAIEVFMRMVQKKVTFFNYDATLYYGIPGQTVKSFGSSIENAIRTMCMHITLLPYPEADISQIQDFYQEAVNILGLTSFEQYTPYHFARPDYSSTWNTLFYSSQASLGFGAGAKWQIDNLRCQNTSDVKTYMAAEGVPSEDVTSVEAITQQDIECDTVKDGLFNLKAVVLKPISPKLREQVESLEQQRLLTIEEDNAALTAAGKARWQTVAAALTL